MKSKSKRAMGGTVMSGGIKPKDPAPTEVYAGGGSNVAKEAVKRKDGGPVHGKKSMMRLDRPGRKMGGRVGADCSPLSSAASTESRSDTKEMDS